MIVISRPTTPNFNFIIKIINPCEDTLLEIFFHETIAFDMFVGIYWVTGFVPRNTAPSTLNLNLIEKIISPYTLLEHFFLETVAFGMLVKSYRLADFVLRKYTPPSTLNLNVIIKIILFAKIHR